jgi:hypothetical protein
LKFDRKVPPFLEVYCEVQLSVVDYIRGDWAGALLHAQASCGPEPASYTERFGTGTLFRQMAYAGDSRRRLCNPGPKAHVAVS